MSKLVKLRERIAGTSFSLSLSLFPRQDKLRIIAVLGIQIFLGLLDLVGIAIIGIIGSLAVAGVGANVVGNRVSYVLDFLSLSAVNLQIQVAILGGIASGFLILKSLVSLYFSRRILLFLSRKSALLSSSLLRKYFGKNLESLQNRSSQEVIYTCTNGVSSVIVGIVGSWINLLSDIALLTILGVGLLAIDPLIALIVTMTFSLVAFVLHQIMHNKVQKIGRFQAENSVLVNRRIQEVLLSFREIYVRDRRGFYARSIGNLQFEMADKSAEMSFMAFIGKYVFEITLVISAVFVSAIQFITQPAGRAISILAIFLAATARIMPAVLRIQQGLLRIRTHVGLASPTIKLIEELRNIPFVSDSPKEFSTEHRDFMGNVNLDNVAFYYTEGSDFRIHDLSLNIKEGEFIALVGSSGSGKTTLVDLILGILEPKSGQITISGLGPKEAVTRWPGAISYVSQDSFLFDGSIRRNLALGFEESEIPDHLFWEALKRAQIADYVRTLPGGLDEDIGERGVKLSGGQRQRVAIARAFITRPRLLVLDEATSSLDGKTEASITDSLNEIKGSLTIITIAHRLSTILKADRIYFLKNGKVLGQGTFEELREKVPEFKLQANLMGL